MFQKQTSKDTNPKNDFHPKDIPIHTMKKDLENLKNLSVSEKNVSPIESGSIKITKNFIPKEKDSPFLKQENWNKKEVWDRKEKQEEKKKEIIPKPPVKMSQKENESNKKEKREEKKSEKEKVIVAIIIILVFLAIGLGGYYFWKTRMRKNVAVPSESLSQNPEQSQKQSPPSAPVKQAQNKNSFLTNEINYLSLDAENSDQASLKKTLQGYVDKVSQSGITSPIEFVVTDSQNNPIGFQTFAKKLGLTLPPNILAQLKTNFSLYIYNDNGATRLGLAIPSKNSNQLKTDLLAEEKKLPRDLQSLFLSVKYTLDGISFKDGNYKGVAIRYCNIVSPEILSIDYAFYQDKFLIGTTKRTIRVIMDSINKTNKANN